MTDKTINVQINGQVHQAAPGETILEVAKRAGVRIPTLCYHEALESVGACRLCTVEITHPDWKGWKGYVTSCLYQVEDGLQVETDSADVREIRKTLLDLLLARCPKSDVIQKLAAQYGVKSTSFKENEDDTVCILCGLCVRVCAVKGCHAIGVGGRGIEKLIAKPFNQPPPDCIGCASCAHICPTGAIPFEDVNGVRKIWGHEFPMVRCEECGEPIMPEKQLAFEANKASLDPSYFTVCAACSQKKTVQTIKTAFDMRSIGVADEAPAGR